MLTTYVANSFSLCSGASYLLRLFLDLQYSLMSYGIPISVFPIDQGGNFQYSLLETRYQRLLEQETEQKKFLSMSVGQTETNVIATDKDVLLGRGVPIQSHPGNLRLAELVDIHHAEYYHSTSKARKAAVTRSIVQTIQNEVGGRFLEKDAVTGMWRVAGGDAARTKVAVCFRSKTKLDKQRQRQHREQQSNNAENSGVHLSTKEDEAIFDELFPDSDDILPLIENEIGEDDGLFSALGDITESRERSRSPIGRGRIISKRRKIAL